MKTPGSNPLPPTELRPKPPANPSYGSQIFDSNGEQLPTRAEFEYRFQALEKVIAELQNQLKAST